MQKQYKNLTLIYWMPPAAMILIALVILFLNFSTPDAMVTPDTGYILSNASIIIAFIAIGVAPVVFRKAMHWGDTPRNLEEKIKKFTSSILIQGAILEAAGLLACIAALATGNLSLLIIPLVLLVVFYVYRPSKFRLTEAASLTPEEKELLDKTTTR